jgi:D-galactarolactone cycloisomerase
MPLLERVRADLPAGVRLMVDAWGSYTPPTAMQVGRVLERLGISWFEEPLPQAGYAGYPALAASLDIAIAGGETLASRSDFKSLIDRRAVDIVQPDVSICGGIGECLFIADMARLAGIQCAPHSWNGPIMHAATLQVAALLPDPSRMPGVDTPLVEVDTTENPFMTDLLVEPLKFSNGAFDLPARPGLGVDVDEARLQKYLVDA